LFGAKVRFYGVKRLSLRGLPRALRWLNIRTAGRRPKIALVLPENVWISRVELALNVEPSFVGIPNYWDMHLPSLPVERCIDRAGKSPFATFNHLVILFQSCCLLCVAVVIKKGSRYLGRDSTNDRSESKPCTARNPPVSQHHQLSARFGQSSLALHPGCHLFTQQLLGFRYLLRISLPSGGIIPGHGIGTDDPASVLEFCQRRRFNTKKVKADVRRERLFQSVNDESPVRGFRQG
jgi:hypothetical protein